MVKARWIRAEKRRCAAILMEAVVLLVMLCAAAIRPAQILNIGCDAFYASGIGTAEYDGASITMSGDTMQSIGVWGYRLKSGAYEVDVRYRSEIEGSKDYRNLSGTVVVQSEQPIKFQRIELKDTQVSAQGRLWIPMGTECTDLSILVGYRGNGMLQLEGVTVTEKCVYRYVRIAYIAVCFLLLDLLYAFFFSGRRTLTEEKKVFLVLCAMIAAACLPFAAEYTPDGHDILYHLQRIMLLGEELKNGQIPARLYTTANNYFGYAAPVFYCDIFLYLPAFLYNCYLPLTVCYQAYVLLMNAMTCFIAYYVYFRITQRRMLGTLGAALYMFCTFRLVNLNVRAAVGEYSAMTFLPLVLLGIYEIYCSEKPVLRDWLPLALGMTGVFFCHMHTTELILIDLVLLCLLLFRPMTKPFRLKAIAKAAGLCMLLCLWFLVPFLDYYLTQDMRIETTSFALQERGLGFAEMMSAFVPGTGIAGIGFVLALGLLVILICLAHQKRWNLKEEKGIGACKMLLVIAVLNMAFAMKSFPWEAIQQRLGTEAGQLGQMISSIQFPWRWLTPASALLVFCLVLAMNQIRKKNRRLYRYFFACLVLSVIISTGYFYTQYIGNAVKLKIYTVDRDRYTDDLWYFLDGTAEDAHVYSAVKSENDAIHIEGYYKKNGIAYLNVKDVKKVLRGGNTPDICLPLLPGD